MKNRIQLAALLLIATLTVAQTPVVPGSILGSLTPITTVNGTLNAVFPVVINTGAPAVLVQLDQTTTITAGAIRFQVSYDGTNFVNTSTDAVTDPTSVSNATISMPYTLVASTNKAFLVNLKGAQALQILESTAMTGTGSVTPYYSVGPMFIGNQATNLDAIAGVAVSAAASGVQKVGVTGSTGAAVDAAGIDATAPANEVVTGGEYNAAPAATLTSTHASPLSLTQTGALLVQSGGSAVRIFSPTNFNAQLSSSGFTLAAPVGTIRASFSSVGGSPSGCAIAETIGVGTGFTSSVWSASLGDLSASPYFFPVSPSTGGASSINAGAGAIVAFTLSCSVYPSSSTAEVVFVSGQAVTLAGGNGYAASVNSAGALSATQADGANVTLGAKADAKSTATDTTAITAMQVLKEISAMEQAPASRAVTQADGADTTLGAKADAKSTATDTTAVSVMSVLKEISAMEQAPPAVALAAGSALVGKVGIDQTTPGTTNAFEMVPDTSSSVALTTAVKLTVTSSVSVKASAGNVYGVSANNGAAAVCWVQFTNSAGAGTLGSAVIFSVVMPPSGTVNIPPGALALANFSTGITVGIASVTNSSSACGTAGNVTVFYK